MQKLECFGDFLTKSLDLSSQCGTLRTTTRTCSEVMGIQKHVSKRQLLMLLFLENLRHSLHWMRGTTVFYKDLHLRSFMTFILLTGSSNLVWILKFSHICFTKWVYCWFKKEIRETKTFCSKIWIKQKNGTGTGTYVNQNIFMFMFYFYFCYYSLMHDVLQFLNSVLNSRATGRSSWIWAFKKENRNTNRQSITIPPPGFEQYW